MEEEEHRGIEFLHVPALRDRCGVTEEEGRGVGLEARNPSEMDPVSGTPSLRPGQFNVQMGGGLSAPCWRSCRMGD